LPGGEPLRTADRRHFEQHYGCDFAEVRLHADARAADASARLRARAFTSGTHVGFAAGRYRPDTPAGQALLGHELAHVAQALAAGPAGLAANTVWLKSNDEPDDAPDDERPEAIYAESTSQPELSVEVTTSTDETPTAINLLNGPEAPVDKTQTAVYEGDVLALRLTGADGKVLTIDPGTLPDALTTSDDSTAQRLLLRVLAPAEQVSVHLRAAGGDGPSAIVTLRLQPRPDPAGADDPDQATNQAARRDLRDERRRSRRARRTERRALRGQARADRRPDRRARRDERRDERQRARDLRKERGQLREQNSCSLEIQRALSAAQKRGVQVCDAALAALSRQPLPAAAMTGLQRHMKISTDSAETPALLQRVVDVLSTARNSLAEADHQRFVCADCKETTGAFVSTHARGGVVTVCQLWRSGLGLKFDPAPGVDEARAYSLVHEFVHLSGPSARVERYVSDTKDWQGIATAQALTMADAYAAVAWAAGSGKTP
jgi:hypothetical protein